MKAGKKILWAMAEVAVLGAAAFWAVGHFHLREAFAASAMGIVIGMGAALGAISSTPTEKMRLKARKKVWPEASSQKLKEGSSPWHYWSGYQR